MSSANFETVDVFVSIAARMVFSLGGNKLSTSSPHVRTLFWFCYVIDKDLSLRTGRPPLVNDDQCDLTLPAEYVQRLHDLASDNTTSKEILDKFPGDIRLSMIKSKCYNALYSAHSLQKSDAELIRTIRELDAELDKWRSTFPMEYRSKFMAGRDSNTHTSMRWTMLTLEYYHCTTTIHQTVSRCSKWNEDSQDAEAVNLSLALCAESSRSALLHLRNSSDCIPHGCYW